MSYGFIKEEYGEEDWVLGSGKASGRFGGEELNPSGDWGAYDPERELQRKNNFESVNCTNYATGNALIALAKFHGFEDFPKNVSERYTGVMTGTTPNGNSPHKVIETIRSECGLIPGHVLDWTDDIDSWDEYYSPNPMTPDFIALGKALLKKFQIGHEWVFHNNSNVTDKHGLLKQALKRGTVCVSVKAWKKKGDRYSKKKGEDDNHWIWLMRFNGDYPVVRDQYSPFVKELEKDYDFERAKVYFLTRLKPPQNYLAEVISWATRTVSKLLELLRQKGETPVLEPPPIPDDPTLPTVNPVTMKTNREKLYDVAAESLGKRMILDKAVPDSLGCASSLSHVLKLAGVVGLPPKGIGSTAVLHKWLSENPQFTKVSSPLPGDVISSPTGTPGAKLSNGHMGIVVKYGICSNNSQDGRWSQHWKLPEWIDYYTTKGRIPTTYFRYK